MVELCLLMLTRTGLARTNATSRKRLCRHPPMVTSCLSKGHGRPESETLTIPRVQTGGLEKTGKCHRSGRAPVTLRLPETNPIHLFYGLSLVGFATRMKAITRKLCEKSRDQARASLLTKSEIPRLGRQDKSLPPCFSTVLLPPMSSPPQPISYLSPRSRRCSFCSPARITIYPASPSRAISKGSYSTVDGLHPVAHSPSDQTQQVPAEQPHSPSSTTRDPSTMSEIIWIISGSSPPTSWCRGLPFCVRGSRSRGTNTQRSKQGNSRCVFAIRLIIRARDGIECT